MFVGPDNLMGACSMLGYVVLDDMQSLTSEVSLFIERTNFIAFAFVQSLICTVFYSYFKSVRQ